MEWYMGKYIRPLSDAVFTIASDDLWIESLAIQQLHTTANLPNMQRVVGMPDLHPGRGYPIGAAFFSVGRFYPTRRRCKQKRAATLTRCVRRWFLWMAITHGH